MTELHSARRRRLGACLAGGALVATYAVAATVDAAQAGAKTVTPGHQVVVSGLNNPRQLDFVGHGLLIAEAGRGGNVATVQTPEGSQGFGYTGSISLVLDVTEANNQRPHRIFTKLPSVAAATNSPHGPKGSGATGSDGVAARNLGDIAVQETFFGPKLAKHYNGKLLLGPGYGTLSGVANISAFEKANDPDGYGFDSDPYAVIDYGRGWLVADAAANDILRVSRGGHISVFHVFHNVTTGACKSQFDPKKPFRGCNWVPTSMATDSHGNVYVGGLSGLQPGLARLVKLDPHGKVLKVWSGFTSITGVAVGHDGSIYVSQLFGQEANPPSQQIQGVVTRIFKGVRYNADVPFPAGLAVDRAGNLYVSTFSILPASGAGIPGMDTSGQVWRMHF